MAAEEDPDKTSRPVRWTGAGKALVDLATTAGLPLAAAVVGLDPQTLAEAGPALAMLGTVSKEAVPEAESRARRFLEGLLGEDPYRAAMRGEKSRELDEVVAATRARHEAQDSLRRGLDAIFEALDPEVIPVIGKLTSEYIRGGQRPDRRFRGLAHVLCALEEGQLAALRRLLEWIAGTAQRVGNDHLYLQLRREGFVDASEIVDQSPGPPAYRDTGGPVMASDAHNRRLLVLLGQNEIADQLEFRHGQPVVEVQGSQARWAFRFLA